MDNAVSILLGFPPTQPFATDEDYDTAVNSHLQQIDHLFGKETATIARHGIEILQVCAHTPVTHGAHPTDSYPLAIRSSRQQHFLPRRVQHPIRNHILPTRGAIAGSGHVSLDIRRQADPLRGKPPHDMAGQGRIGHTAAGKLPVPLGALLL